MSALFRLRRGIILSNIFLPLLFGDFTRYQKGDIESLKWNRALNDLRYGAPRWKYFALRNPPKEPYQSSYGASITYTEVQEGIKNLANAIEQGEYLNNQSIQMVTYMRQVLENLKENAIKAELDLFQRVIDNEKNNNNNNLNIDYNSLVKNSEIASKRKTLVREISYNNSIDFWTRVFYNQLNDSAPISEKDAFAIIITSRDFYNHLTTGMERISSIFSRHGALNSKGLNEQAKQITNKIDYDSLQILFEEYNHFLDNNVFSLDGTIDQAIISELRESMTNIMGNYFKRDKYGEIDFTKKIRRAKLQLATSVSKTIRENLERTLRELKNKYAIENSLSIKLANEDELWFYVSSDYGAVNKLYQDKNKNLQGQRLVKDIVRLIKENIETFQVNRTFLDLNGFKVQFNNIQIQNSSIQGWQGLKQGALNFINTGAIYSFLNRTYQRSAYWKSFNIANSNQFLSGLLGELSANFLSENILKSKMTGSLFSSLSGKAESVNDLQLSLDRYHRKGINIKHYIVSASGSIDLYSKEVNFSIYDNDLTEKYLGARDTQLLRFIVENEGFFSGGDKKINKIETKIVASHFPEFLRIHDYDKNSSYNLFFMINNVVYPTSYIYSCALAQLEQIKKNEQDVYNLFASATTKGSRNQKEMYDTRDDAYAVWTEQHHELRGFTSPTGRDLYVNTKGLKVNLVNLTLFS